MPRTLIIWGCTSGAGKSWLTTGLCRLAARRGVVVAPFKAQNMSNNARVVADATGQSGEIGSAQFFQALAAGVVPGVDHNPVLLKPESDRHSQVVVHGRVDAALSRQPWLERSKRLALLARASFERLARGHELLIVEGAGSPAEINLAAHDYVNLGCARWARAAGPTTALLVADIDRGGAFAHLYGTQALLPDDLRPLLQGFVLNRFRGDPALLAPAPEQLRALTGVPLAGVVPMLRDHGLPEEDALFDDRPRAAGAAAGAPLRVAVVAAPRISNHDEFQSLLGVPGLELRWAREPAHLQGVDWVVLPGSKQVSGDLAWLRATGLDAAITAHAARGAPVLGLCGGLQMLGRSLHDPAGHDGEAFEARAGLGLLPLVTRFERDKRLCRHRVHFGAPAPPWQALAGVETDGYEIRCGATVAAGAAPVLFDPQGQAIGWQQGSVLGLYAHGVFESPALLRSLFGAAVKSLEQRFDTVADVLEAQLDARLVERWLHG